MKYSVLFKFFLVILIVSNSNFLISQTAVNQKKMYQAFISGNWKLWYEEIVSAEKRKNVSTQEKTELIELYYFYTGHLLSVKNYTEAEKFVRKGDLLIGEILKSEPANSTVLAFKASFTGFKIPMNRLKIFQLGNESFKYMNTAYETDKSNIQALTDRGSALFFTPKIFGGNKTEAIKMFEKAVRIIELNKSTDQNVKYLNLLTLLVRSYEKTDQIQKASMTYKKILLTEPDFLWVKNELYPAFLKSVNK